MFDTQQTKTLQELTTSLLKDGATDIDKLRAVLRFHEYRYYVQTDPLISDF